jgi:hypothetical protein
MIAPSYNHKHYHSAHSRFLPTLLAEFFQRELPRFGPLLSQRLADEVVRITEAVWPPRSRLQPGQLLWNVVDKNTRADSPKRRLIPVILNLIHPEDIAGLEKGASPVLVFRQGLARLFREAHAQGGLLSTRDAALIFHRDNRDISTARQLYETQHDCLLPHPGNLQDMGSTISHKALVVRKVLLERKDPAAVAHEINHSQKAVDHYLSDYHRVKTLYDLKPDPDFIHQATHIAKHVVIQYIGLITKQSPINSPNGPTKSKNNDKKLDCQMA